MSSRLVALVAGLALTIALGKAVELRAESAFSASTMSVGHNSSLSAYGRSLQGDCAFENGTTTCTYVGEFTHTTYHDAVSGCLYGPNAVPGRRTRTFEDTYLVTVTTTTLARGRSGPVYNSSTSTSETLMSSQVVSDVCEAI